MPTTKAKRRATVVPQLAPAFIADALTLLGAARDKLRSAGSKKAADYVARAMKSAEGARRHAEGIAMRQTAGE